jgi:RHS repeat-associated protein
MFGGTINYAYWPMPGGGSLLETGNSGSDYYLHKDWLGNARISTSVAGHALVADNAFAPFGETYNILDSSNQNQQMFTGLTQDVLSGMWDTPNRELSASQGRWLSPDPAGSGWNQYAYVNNNPLNAFDPTGLDRTDLSGHWQNFDAIGSQDGNCFGDPNCATYEINGVAVSQAYFLDQLDFGNGAGGGEFWAVSNQNGHWAPTGGGIGCDGPICALPFVDWVANLPNLDLLAANNGNCQNQLCVWNVPPCRYTPCFKALPPVPTASQCLASPGDAVPELPGAAPEQPDAPPGPPPPTGTEVGQSKVDGLGVLLGYFADSLRCWAYKLSW